MHVTEVKKGRQTTVVCVCWSKKCEEWCISSTLIWARAREVPYCEKWVKSQSDKDCMRVRVSEQSDRMSAVALKWYAKYE